jgi:MFS transporter, DHA1 family, multidrug resistance protein
MSESHGHAVTTIPSSARPSSARAVPRQERRSIGGRFAATGLGREHVPLLLVVTLAVLNAAAPLSTDMYLSAMPRMSRDLGTDAASVQLTLTTFMLGVASGQLVIGSLSDRWGRRRPLLVNVVIFLVSGVLCALAPSVGVLIALRFIQGFSGSAGMVIGRAIVSDSVRGVAAARTYSLLMVVGAVAPVLAPLSGAAIDALAGWRAIFAVLGVAGLVMLLGVVFVVQETLPWHRRNSGGLIQALKLAQDVLSNRQFLGYLLTLVFAFGGMFAYISASPFVIQDVLGLSSGHYALDFAVNSIGLISMSTLSARLVGRVSPLRLLTLGIGALSLASIGLLVITLGGLVQTWTVLPLLFVVTASMGLVFGNGVGLAMGSITHGSGTASAVLGSLQFGLAALVSPLVGLGGEFTAVPMAIVMTCCVFASAVSLLGAVRHQRALR